MYDGCKSVIGNSSNNFFEGCRRAQMGWFGTSGYTVMERVTVAKMYILWYIVGDRNSGYCSFMSS